MASEEEQHSGGDAVVAALEQAGVRVVFGIPSVHNLPIYDALARRGKIRAITVRHEQGAAGAADGYARSSGRIGVFITSTGPGAANAMGGLLEAYVSGSPVLHLTGQVETAFLGKGRGFIHEVPDQPAMLASLSKAVLRAESAGEIGRIVEAAIELALSHPRGPVSVELPIDLQYAPAGSPPAARDLPQASDAPDGEPAWVDAARAALPVLSAAKRPIIWAGGGAVSSGAEDEVAVLAGRLGAGVLTSPNGRGVISELDPLCIGNLSWDPDVRSLLREADVLIGLGTRYQGPNTENWKMELPGRIIQVDVDLRVPSLNYEPEIAVPGDVKEVLGLILQELPEPSVDDRVWRQRIEQAKVAAHGRLRKSLGAQQGLLDALSPLVADGTVVVKDSTIPAYTWGNRLLPVSRPRTAIMPNGFAIGLGLAHAMGAAAAGDGKPVVCMAGDGGFMLTATELATIAREHLPVVVALFNDGGYGILRNIQARQYERQIGVDLGSPDFCGLARSLGVGAERVESAEAFGKVMADALERREPYLVEVDLDAVGPMARPYTGTSRPPSTPPAS